MGNLEGVSEPGSPPTSNDDRTLLVTRVCCGVLIACDILAWYESGPLGLLLLPIAIGALVPLINLPNWIAKVEGLDSFLVSRRELAKGKSGKFARFFSAPLWSGSVVVHGITQRIPLENVRAATRLTLLIYYFGAFLAVAGFVAYISIAILIFIGIVILVLWIVFKVWLGDSSDSGAEKASGSWARLSSSGTTRHREGFMGLDPHVEYFDDKGNKVWEGRQKEGLLGLDPHMEYTDTTGRKIAEGREQEGLLGLDPHTEYTDTEGHKVAEGREREGILGLDPHTEVTDPDGRVVSTARHRDGLLGLDPHIEHREE